MDEIWSLVGNKSHQYWLWWVIDHPSGESSAFHFGTGEYETLDEWLALLKPFDIKGVYADNNDAYQSQGTHSEVVMGTKTQRIERKHRSLQKISEESIRFSKDHGMHQIVVALLINFWFFQSIIWYTTSFALYWMPRVRRRTAMTILPRHINGFAGDEVSEDEKEGVRAWRKRVDIVCMRRTGRRGLTNCSKWRIGTDR
ncbi:putative insertion element IS1 protein InsB [Hollandina sp. SP2]